MVSTPRVEAHLGAIARPDVLKHHKLFLSQVDVQKQLAVLGDVFKVQSLVDLPAPSATKYTKPAATDDVGPEPAIFTDHNGIQLTQEQIDAEGGDAEEENAGWEKDADMADDSGQRQEAEPGDTARDRFLREGANNVMNVLKQPAKVPQFVAQTCQVSCTVLRRAWLVGPEKTDTALLRAVNKAMTETRESIEEGKTYTLDFENILQTIYTIHDSMLWWFDNQESFPRSKAGKSCALLALSLVKLLDCCGLDWKSVVPAELRTHINKILTSAMKDLPPEVQDMLVSLAGREKHATRLQEMTIQPALNHLSCFFDACKKGDTETMGSELNKLAPINKALQEANVRAGFKADDRLLPTGILRSCIQRAKRLEHNDEAIALANSSRAYFGKILRDACGYYNMGTQLTENMDQKELGVKLSKQVEMAIERLRSTYEEPVQDIIQRTKRLDITDASLETSRGSEEAFDDPKHLKTPISSKFSLPSMKDGHTEFGKLISIQPLPREAFRTTINSGTDKFPLLISLPASEFGRETIKDLKGSLTIKKSAPVNVRRRAHVKEIYDVVTIPRSSTESKSTGTVMLCIRYHEDKTLNPLADDQPLEEVRSRTDCIVILGKETVNTREAVLIKAREQRLRYILACVHRGLNPDTREVADETVRADMCWLWSMPAFDLGCWYIRRLGYEYSVLGLPLIKAQTQRRPWYLGDTQNVGYGSTASFQKPSQDRVQFGRASDFYELPLRQRRSRKVIGYDVASPVSPPRQMEYNEDSSVAGLDEHMTYGGNHGGLGGMRGWKEDYCSRK